MQESEPEIKRVNLSSVILLLKASGVKDIVNFDYMDRPTRPACMIIIKSLNFSDQGVGRTLCSRST